MPSIIIGAKEGGTKVADHASSIDTLIEVDKDGNINKTSFKPSSSNPGQETMQFIDGHFSDAEAFIIGLMQGPPNSKRRIVQVESDENVEEVIEQYKQGKSYSEESSSSEENTEKEGEIGVPLKTGAGKGVRAQKGRGGHPPEEQEVYGKGSGTRYGRVAEASPRMAAYQGNNTSSGNAQNTTNNKNTTQNTIDTLIEKYSNATTDEQKENAAQAVKQYLKEAADKNLKGKDAEEYVAKRLEEDGYSKNKKSSSSKESSEETNADETAEKVA